MPKLVIGNRTNMPVIDLGNSRVTAVDANLAASTISNLKKKLKDHPDTTWIVIEYKVNAGLKGLIEFAEGNSEELSKGSYRVLPTGRVMSI